MKNFVCLSAALLLALTASQASQAQGRGNGKGRGGDHNERDQVRGGPEDVSKHGPKDDKAKGKKGDKDKEDKEDGKHQKERQDVIVVRSDHVRGLIAGCPPGLAKRNNGCLPPGQERKQARARYEGLWGRPSAVNNPAALSSYTQRYDSGYLYRYDQQGGLMGYLPLLAGALSSGNLWPRQYSYDTAPRYQTDYYGLNSDYDYRYADGAIYGVDRNTSSIQQISALLTGQSASVGQRMPDGYDVYNVPYAYRGEYADTPDRAYRYNDGAVYQLDPKTQVVQAIIKLLT